MKILITGITGFIGSELARKLVKDSKYRVAGLVRISSNKNDLDPIADIAHKVTLLRANLTDYYALQNVVKKFAPDYILHIGAQTAVRDSFEMPHEFNEANYLGTINLIHAALNLPRLKKFIFASTMETYGFQKEKRPFKENILLHPGSPYAVSKAACEYYLEMVSKVFGLPYIILRPCNTYGRKHNAGFIVEYLITKMLAGEDVYIGTPKAVRDLMYVDDHVNAYLTLLRSKEVNRTFNFGNGSGITMMELAKKIKSMLGFKGKIIAERFPPDYPTRPIAEDYLSLDSSKAKKVLGWQARYSLDEGLNKAITYWRNKQ
ncbi:MAG: GDP-mannose 4,6-dehydratase [bacterium]|nr:GDP-mannose 4,6-dehydratase [bacterium]